MEIHSSTLAWIIPWTEEPGGLQSMESQRFGHNGSNLACLYDCSTTTSCPFPRQPDNDHCVLAELSGPLV